jgi:16S rRNA (guanine966-N2)-methyltransferase
MRVIAGLYGGRRLTAPKGAGTRPTADRVREALFSILGSLDGLRVLDLYAGAGTLGIEALSRGAAWATFVEHARPASAALQANLDTLGIAADVVRKDTRSFLRDASAQRHTYDLVFLDPPYRSAPEVGRELPAALAPLLSPGARVVTESDRRAPLELPLPVTHDRRYGDTLIRIHTHGP